MRCRVYVAVVCLFVRMSVPAPTCCWFTAEIGRGLLQIRRYCDNTKQPVVINQCSELTRKLSNDENFFCGFAAAAKFFLLNLVAVRCLQVRLKFQSPKVIAARKNS